MPIQAVTLDFWNTMVVAGTGGEARRVQRERHLLSVGRCYRPELTEHDVRACIQAARTRFDATWRAEHRTPTTHELLEHVWEVLTLEVHPDEHAETVRIFEEGLLHGPPDWTPGLEDFLREASRHVRLGIISDTMFSPGRVIRQRLQQADLLRYFDAFVFSDETGCSKPDPRAFGQALAQLDAPPEAAAHVGDLRRTDIAGAKAAGLSAILYTGVHHDTEGTAEPDAVAPDWATVLKALERR